MMAPRFAGVPVEQAGKPRFAGVPVQADTPSASPTAQNPYFADLPIPGTLPEPKPDPRHGEWNEPGAIVPIQFQQGTGAMRPAVPGLITDAISAITAPGKAAHGEYDEVQVLPDGSVSRFDPEMMDDATNLASMAPSVTPAARLVGGAVKAVTRQATPEIDDLYIAKDAAYKAVDDLGARYGAQAIDNMASEMLKRAGADNISPDIHPKSFALLARVQNSPRDMSLTQLDQLRQEIRRDLIGSDKGEAHFGREFINVIDDFIEKATPASVRNDTPGAANTAIQTARQAHSVLRKSETLQDALEDARLNAASSGSGGNIDNSIRQSIKRVIRQARKKPGSFSKEELAMMDDIVAGGGKLRDKVLRVIGKLSPSGNGLMAALGLGATFANPLAVAAPAAGLVAKTISDRATQSGVNALTRMVRTGEPNAVSRLGSGTSPITPKANTTLIEQNLPNSLVQRPNSLVRLST